MHELLGLVHLPLLVVALIALLVHSYFALELLDRHLVSGPNGSPWMLAGASLCFGTGVWSMHFIVSIAWHVSEPFHYDLLLLSVSHIAMCIAVWAGFSIGLSKLPYGWRIGLAALALTVGGYGMHYIGMEAMHVTATYDWLWFGLFAAASLLLATLGLSKLFANTVTVTQPGWTALLLSAAIFVMHTTSMLSMGEMVMRHPTSTAWLIDDRTVAYVIALLSLVSLVLYMTGSSANRSKLHASLRMSSAELRYGSLFLHHPDTVLEMDRGGLIVNINPAVYAVSGYTPQECLSRSVIEFALPQYRSLLQTHMDRCLNGQTGSYMLETVHRDGSAIDLEVTYMPIYSGTQVTGAYVICRNVTQTNTIQRLLAESGAKFRQMTENMNDLVAVISRDGEFQYVSPSHEATLGYKPVELIGRRICELLPESEMTKVYALLEEWFDTAKPFAYRTQLTHKDGRMVELETKGTMLFSGEGHDAGTGQIMLVTRDITSYVTAERKQQEAEQILRDSRDLYYRLQTSLDRFTADLYGMKQADDLERRVLQEVRKVLRIERVRIERRERLCADGDFDGTHTGSPIGQLILQEGGLPAVVISETVSSTTLLVIEEACPKLKLEPVRVWLQTLARSAHVVYAHYHVIEHLVEELKASLTEHQTTPWLQRVIFNLSENERRRLSQDLHDSALQEQILWYRKLEALCDSEHLPDDTREAMRTIGEGLLDVIYQIRMTCNELRPPMLKDWGIIEALRQLFGQTQLRSDYRIRFNADRFDAELTDEHALGVYRIVQELLANASKHSNASEVEFELSSEDGFLHLTYRDNGIGMSNEVLAHPSVSMGLSGIIERVKSLEGTVAFRSERMKGVTVSIRLPLELSNLGEACVIFTDAAAGGEALG